MPSDSQSTALANAWCHNLWRCSLNHFAVLLQAAWRFVPSENIAQGLLPDSFNSQDVNKVWVAPVVWQKKINQTYWIPIWIPAFLKDKAFYLSQEQLPWMPPNLFLPDVEESPFIRPIHCFDEWLRFEWLDEEGKLSHQSWTEAYQAIQALLESLSNHTWEHHLQALEFTQNNAIVMVAEENNSLCANPLSQTFATIWDHEPQIAWDHKKCSQQAQHLGLFSQEFSKEELEAAVHVLALKEGELLAVRSPVGVNTAKFIASIADQIKSGLYLFNQKGLKQYDPVKQEWQHCDAIINGTLLIIENAQRFHPQLVFPLLTQVKTALFLGDNQDITALPCMSAMPESWDLAYHGIVDDELLDQLHYKGMLPSTGNAMSVALANSAYQQLGDHGLFSNTFSLLKDPPLFQCQGIMVESESKVQGNGLMNEGEAQFIVSWLMSGPLNQDWKNTAIVTPFVQQRDLIAHYLERHKVPSQVFTFFGLTAMQWPHVIFSPVYTSQQQRPFIFDQGEDLLYSLMRRAQKVWVIGSLDIFNPRMQSPSGKLGRRLLSKETYNAS